MAILTKKKLCAGFDGVSHEAYIYKNIDGKKYCKSCALKLQPKKSIKKMSDKGRFKMILKKKLFEHDKKFYSEVWADRFFVENKNIPGSYIMAKAPRCENPECRKRLSDKPNLLYFHHILEKRNYPEYRHIAKNIAILCAECHNLYETYPDKVPFLVERRKYLIALFLKTKQNEQQSTSKGDQEHSREHCEGSFQSGN